MERLRRCKSLASVARSPNGGDRLCNRPFRIRPIHISPQQRRTAEAAIRCSPCRPGLQIGMRGAFRRKSRRRPPLPPHLSLPLPPRQDLRRQEAPFPHLPRFFSAADARIHHLISSVTVDPRNEVDITLHSSL